MVAEGEQLPKQHAKPEGLHWRQFYKDKINIGRLKLKEEQDAKAEELQKQKQQKISAELQLKRERNEDSSSTLSVCEDIPTGSRRDPDDEGSPSGRRPKRQRQASGRLATSLQTSSDKQLMQSVLRNSLHDC